MRRFVRGSHTQDPRFAHMIDMVGVLANRGHDRTVNAGKL